MHIFYIPENLTLFQRNIRRYYWNCNDRLIYLTNLLWIFSKNIILRLLHIFLLPMLWDISMVKSRCTGTWYDRKRSDYAYKNSWDSDDNVFYLWTVDSEKNRDFDEKFIERANRLSMIWLTFRFHTHYFQNVLILLFANIDTNWFLFYLIQLLIFCWVSAMIARK